MTKALVRRARTRKGVDQDTPIFAADPAGIEAVLLEMGPTEARWWRCDCSEICPIAIAHGKAPDGTIHLLGTIATRTEAVKGTISSSYTAKDEDSLILVLVLMFLDGRMKFDHLALAMPAIRNHWFPRPV